MTKDDFYIIRNSITMSQVAEHYGLQIIHKSGKDFIRCPFHKSGSERTPSIQIYEGYRGFYCRGCGTGGDVTRFVELYEGVSTKEAALLLSEQFGVPISDNSEIPEEVRQKAQQAELERQRELMRSKEIQAKLNHLGTLIYGYRRLLDSGVTDTDIHDYICGELPMMEWQWDELFSELKK
ncbi:MAG TPA: CHC2 zinc finger domain-containing protein [Mobilitalea sp.]|nr:CHC2 zinc finger domain-containing protein [Mobilitalea sp.]